MRNKAHQFLLAIGLMSLAVLATHALASTCDITEFGTTGTLTAERLNQRVRQTETCINGRIGNSNFDSSDPLAVTKLANKNANSYVPVQLACVVGDGAFQFKLPVSSTLKTLSVTCHGCTLSDAVNVVAAVDVTSAVGVFGINSTTPALATGGTATASSANVVNFNISGSISGCATLDVVLGVSTQLQP